MLDLDIKKMENGYDRVNISTDEGHFDISFQKNLDLYFNCSHDGSILDSSEEREFFITRENSYLYYSFENLFYAIKNSMPYYNSELKDKYYQLNKYESTESKGLFTDNKITWYSDDEIYEYASKLTIEKLEDEYKVTFTKSKFDNENQVFPTYSVRIRTSGSRYEPYYIPFMNMYNHLREYNYQISIDDYLYQMKLLKK